MRGAVYSSRGYDSRELAGIEILPDPQPAAPPADDPAWYPAHPDDSPKQQPAAALLRGRATLEV